MDDVEMDKVIDLVTMADKRVNVDINELDAEKLLARIDSKHIRNNIADPKFLEKENRHDSILLKMI
jgi:hypothetical protein